MTRTTWKSRSSRWIWPIGLRARNATLLDFLDAQRSYRSTELSYRQALASYMGALEHAAGGGNQRAAITARRFPYALRRILCVTSAYNRSMPFKRSPYLRRRGALRICRGGAGRQMRTVAEIKRLMPQAWRTGAWRIAGRDGGGAAERTDTSTTPATPKTIPAFARKTKSSGGCA